MRLLTQAGVYVANRHYFTATHDLLEDYFAALVLDHEWENDRTELVLACRSNPKLSETWKFLGQIRPEIAQQIEMGAHIDSSQRSDQPTDDTLSELE
jgi:hypothetical protein